MAVLGPLYSLIDISRQDEYGNTQAVIFIYQLNNNSSNVSLFAKTVNIVK